MKTYILEWGYDQRFSALVTDVARDVLEALIAEWVATDAHTAPSIWAMFDGAPTWLCPAEAPQSFESLQVELADAQRIAKSRSCGAMRPTAEAWSGSVLRVPPGGSLAEALKNAKQGDTIVLEQSVLEPKP